MSNDDFFGFTQTDENGEYDINGLHSGDYTVSFSSCGNGDYLTEYYDDAATTEAAAAVTVTAPDTTADIDASLGGSGHITGTVTDAEGIELEGICVAAFDEDGPAKPTRPPPTGPTTSADSGRATTPSGSATAGTSSYLEEFHDDATSEFDAEPVYVTAPDTTAGIDAALGLGGHITGTVTADDGGEPLQEVCVYAPRATTSPDSRPTDEEGNYDLRGLAYRLRQLHGPVRGLRRRRLLQRVLRRRHQRVDSRPRWW